MAKVKVEVKKIKSAFYLMDDAYILDIDHPGLDPIKSREYSEYSHALIACSLLIHMIKPLHDVKELNINNFEFNRRAIFQFLGIKE